MTGPEPSLSQQQSSPEGGSPTKKGTQTGREKEEEKSHGDKLVHRPRRNKTDSARIADLEIDKDKLRMEIIILKEKLARLEAEKEQIEKNHDQLFQKVSRPIPM